MPPMPTYPCTAPAVSSCAKALEMAAASAVSRMALGVRVMVAPLSHEAARAARGGVAAVDFVMAVEAAARDEARVGAAGGRRLEVVVRVVHRARVAGGVVAVLAQVGHLLVQELH